MTKGSTMPTAVIVDAVRTPGGKRNGKLKNWHAVDLAAAGVEVMSRVTMGSSIGKDSGWPFGPSVAARYEPVGGLKNQGIGAEMIADQWDVSREDLDAFSAESHRRAAQATAEGRFDNEIVPVFVRDDEGHDTDEL